MNGVLLVLFFGALLILGPIFTIWSLNCLFDTGIPVNGFTYLSVLWLGITLKAHTVDK